MKKPTKKKLLSHPTDQPPTINAMKRVFPMREEMHGVLREEIDEAKEELLSHIKRLPTKEEFLSRMDELSGEIKAVRQEQIIHADEHRKINDRFDRINHHIRISTAE